MHAFTYYNPTEVIFGENTQSQTAAYVKKYGGTRVLLVYGGGSIRRSGLLDQICNDLADNRIACEPFGGARPNPTLEHAREGVKKALAFQADFILGVGGGSAIDTAKAIAHGAANPNIDIWDFWQQKEPLEKSLPIGAILTIPAAGSETSSSSVLTNAATGRKSGLPTELNRPRFAIMNPQLSFTLPRYQIGCGVTDIMMHTLDRYFNPLDNELTDAIAEALLRTVIRYGAVALNDPHNYEAMSELMWAGSLSHNGLTGLGGDKDFAVHQLGHELSASFDTAHGASLSTVWGAWATYVYSEKPSRFSRYAQNVWGLNGRTEDELALAGIKATVDYFRTLGMPTSFGTNTDIGIQDETSLHRLAYRCAHEGTRTIGSFKVMNESDICHVYQAANH